MIEKVWKSYLFVNYCGQRVTGSFFNERSVINTIMFELSFITSGLPFLVISFLGIRIPWIGALIALLYVLLLWWWGENRLKSKVDFEYLEKQYLSTGKVKRFLCLPFAITIFILTFLFMLIMIKMIF